MNSALQLPILDISNIDKLTGSKLMAISEQHGFFYVRFPTLGLKVNDINNVFTLARQFFESADEEKQPYRIDATKNNHGWTPMRAENLVQNEAVIGDCKDCKEAYDFAEFKDGNAQQVLPKCFVEHENDRLMSRFSQLCWELCQRLFQLYAIGLKIPLEKGGKEWLSSRHNPANGPSGTILRLLYYPFQSFPLTVTDTGAGAHTDFGSLTLLFRLPNQPGLEIQTSDSEWAAVPVNPPGTEEDPFPPILVNIGDLLSFMTKGLLKSTVHRVVTPDFRNKTEDRYSIAYFSHPCMDTKLDPTPSYRVHVPDEEVKGQQSITAGEYLKSKIEKVYGATVTK